MDTSAPARPADSDVVPIGEVFGWQADYCRKSGAPLAAAICEAVVADVGVNGPLASLLPSESRFGDLLALRVMAVVHRLALERRVPLVAMHVPTLGGTVPPDSAVLRQWQCNVVEALAAHPDAVVAGLARTPQTNEPGRAAVLRAALTRLDSSRPVRLREIGASAGLNLRADLLPGVPRLERGPIPPIADRVGCDLAPIDPTSHEGRLLLTSFVWVDHVDRFERLRHALAVAATTPAEVVHCEAADFVDDLELADGFTTVLWHSALWSYLAESEQQRLLKRIEQLGAQATSVRQFVHVSWEWPAAGTDEFVGTMRMWNGDERGHPIVFMRGWSHGDHLRE